MSALAECGKPQARASDAAPNILDVRDLRVVQRADGQPLVYSISFTLAAGACLGIVGESGSGKTLTCRSLMGLLPPTLAGEGSAVFNGIDLVDAPAEQLRQLRGSKIAMVYHFIEFMACPGGCVCGGGQPIMPNVLQSTERKATSLFASLKQRLANTQPKA